VRRHRQRLVAVVAAVVATRGASAQQLTGHSISSPPDINAFANDWFLGGSMIPSQKTVVMSPGVPGRLGLLWHKFPLLTNDFEIALTLQVKAPEKDTAKDAHFAFWYVNENATQAQEKVAAEFMHNQDEMIRNTWGSALISQGFNLIGYRGLYDGLGVFFAETARIGESGNEPCIVGLVNDGKTDVQNSDLGQKPGVLRFNWKSGKEVTVKIRVQPTKATIELEGGVKQEVAQAFKAGGYIGLSAFGGMKGSHDLKEKSSFVELKTMTVTNMDTSSKGEDYTRATPTEKPKDEDRVDVLHEQSSFKDHRAESDAIKELTNMVFKLVVESQPMRAQVTTAIESITKRLTLLEKTFETIKTELNKKTGHDLSQEFEDIKKELSTLSSVASTESQEKHKKLDALHQDISTVHKAASAPDKIDKHIDKLTQSTQRTLDSLTNEHQKMFGVSIAAIAFIIIAGLSLYNKFRCWEKKHVL